MNAVRSYPSNIYSRTFNEKLHVSNVNGQTERFLQEVSESLAGACARLHYNNTLLMNVRKSGLGSITLKVDSVTYQLQEDNEPKGALEDILLALTTLDEHDEVLVDCSMSGDKPLMEAAINEGLTQLTIEDLPFVQYSALIAREGQDPPSIYKLSHDSERISVRYVDFIDDPSLVSERSRWGTGDLYVTVWYRSDADPVSRQRIGSLLESLDQYDRIFAQNGFTPEEEQVPGMMAMFFEGNAYFDASQFAEIKNRLELIRTLTNQINGEFSAICPAWSDDHERAMGALSLKMDNKSMEFGVALV